MKNKINISIPQPCHENWQIMTPLAKGKFCNSCQKNVNDFTKSSDREIVNAISKNGNLCGRFNTSQLNRDLILPQERNRLWTITATTILSFLGLLTEHVYSQEKTSTEQTNRTNAAKTSKTKEVHPNKQRINGIVLDENNMPLPIADIKVNGLETSFMSDLDGNFAIDAAIGDTLVFRYVGYLSKKLIISDLKNYTVNLTEDNSPVSIGAFITIKKRTFAGKIFHSIGNLFRKKDR